MIECSVVIPFCNEVPQVLFTIQSLIEELDGFCKYEIIVIDNLSDNSMACVSGERKFPIRQRNFFMNPNTGHTIGTYFFRKGIVKYFTYDEKQSHWQAKNVGIRESSGKFVMFLDAHCVMKRDSVRKMIQFLRNPPEERIGGVHAYINYMLDSHSLEYKVQKKTFGYQFCSAQIDPVTKRRRTKPYKVCVMSTCGMMCPRSTLDELGGWNREFGIYGGGESYMNWKQSTCGYHHWIHPEAECWHWAEKRGYSWNHTDFVRNSFIAAYCIGGEKFLTEQVEQRVKKDRPDVINRLADDVREKCKPDMEFIHSKQVESFEEYITRWEANPGTWK